MDNFEYELNLNATIARSGEFGTIVARAQYLNQTNRYLLQYVGKDGVARDGWFDTNELDVIR